MGDQTGDIVGLVSTAISSEASQDEFFFWIDKRRLAEASQLVRVTMPLPPEDPRVKRSGKGAITVIGVVEEVKRQSESQSVGADHARYNGKHEEAPLLPPTGFSYAHCRVLAVDPPFLIPLTEGLPVHVATEDEAGRGYGYPEMQKANSDLIVGLLKNGGAEVAGSAKLDTRYVLGEFGGHVNVTGVAGTGTKTSFLMVLVKMLVIHARAKTRKSTGKPLYITPVVFNVKGNDLMWINQPNQEFDLNSPDWEIYRQVWSSELFDEFATPFRDACFYSFPDRSGHLKLGLPPGTKPYSWGLQDVVEWGVEKYLFSEETRDQELVAAVLTDAFNHISRPDANAPSGRTLDPSNDSNVLTFDDLVNWISQVAAGKQGNGTSASHYLATRHDAASIRAAARRVRNILTEAEGVLEAVSSTGKPPTVTADMTCDPIVVDIDRLESAPQRFVVAAVIERIKRHREKHADRRQRYVIVLDELNRFAPKGSRDEVTKLFEHVAAQLRSQGILLFGAQQKASSIAPLVWENAATKVLGRTGAVELSAEIWGNCCHPSPALA